MCDILDSSGDERVIAQVRQQVVSLCARFPVYVLEHERV